jgi:eukaryotic-like serine/threonine-protein kinase
VPNEPEPSPKEPGGTPHGADSPAASTGPAARDDSGRTVAEHPARLGRYSILRVLGEGGMGTVFEAEQENPRRSVALKVIRASVLSPESLRRFSHESQVLGRLQHPGIAQIYEAGTVQDERGSDVPFFAMEFVAGVPLTEHAARKHLGTRERLDLVARICDAVSHAHQKGVIHRDLKPGNILVDDSGQPKILDFGVARATNSDIQQTTLQTDVGQLIGTVPYMSPEQVAGDPSALDTRSDVYALGVIAYELLVGRLPYDLKRKMIHEAVRIIKEDEPTRLSSIDRTLRGDVETIVAKALEKDKVRRYPSAESLASDIRRYLRHETITARPASTWYQVQKFSRRNPALVLALLVAFFVLVAGLIGTSYGLKQAVHARDAESLARADAVKEKEAAVDAREAEARERNVAVAQRDKAEKIAEFMSQMLQGVGPSVARGRDIAMLKEMMDVAAARIEAGDLKSAPEAELRLRRTIGFTYDELALYPESAKMLEPAAALARSLYPGDHEEKASALDALAHLVKDRGDLAGAEPLSRESLAMKRRLFPGDHEEVATALNDLAVLLQDRGDLARAEPLYRESIEMRKRLFPGDHADVATGLNSLSYLLRARGDRAGALPLCREALEMFQRLYPGDHPDVATGLNNLGVLLLAGGDLAGAEPPLRESLAMMKRLYPGDHPSVAVLESSLAGLLYSRGDLAGAEPLYRESLEMKKRLFPGDHPSVATGLGNLGRVLQRRGRLSEAEALLRESLAMNQRLFPGDNPNVADGLGYVSELLLERGDPAEAERLSRESLAMDQRVFKGDHPDVADGLCRLAGVLVVRGDFAGAEALARDGVAMSERTRGKDHWRTASARVEHGRALAGLRRFADGEAELVDAERVLSTAHGAPPGRHKQCVEGLTTLYESWSAAEPDKGHDAQASEWKAKLDADARDEPR